MRVTVQIQLDFMFSQEKTIQETKMPTLAILLVVTSFLQVVWANAQEFDCVDVYRTLRCVVPSNCPSHLVLRGKKCPAGRTCCRKDKPNIYLPLRRQTDAESALKGRSLFDDAPTVADSDERDYIEEDDIARPFNRIQDTKKNPFSTRFRKESNNLVFGDFPPKSRYQDITPVRKSVKYCRLYTKLTIDVGYASPLLNELVPLRYEMENCDPSISPLVVGGTNAHISEFPHMVALGYNRSRDLDYLCGGTLISDQFVLTAAHCIRTKWGGPTAVFMGATLLHSKKGHLVPVGQTFVHPGYAEPSYYNDIALIKLSRPVRLSSKLRPACLPTGETSAQYPDNVAVATGWGRTGFGRDPSPALLKVALKVLDNKKCSSFYETDKQSLISGVSSDMICAVGNTDSSEDTCQGDSGGPLQSYLPNNRCMLQVVGITSFGKSCGGGTPGVYTRVASYLSWIENIVWP